MSHYFYQPEYFSKFRCLGGECPVSCCDGWNVYWTKAEVAKLKGAEMHDELRKMIEDNFELTTKGIPETVTDEQDKEQYVIRLCDDKRCPFHERGTDLCMIQRSIGEENFGVVCGLYPRRRFMMQDNGIISSCSSSCPAVLKLLLHDKRAAKMESIPITTVREIQAVHTDAERKAAPAYLKFRKDLIEYYSYVFTSDITFEEAMLMGAIAAHNFSDPRNQNDLPQCVDIIRKEVGVKDVHRITDKIAPVYMSKYNIALSLLYKLSGKEKDFLPVDISVMSDGEKFDTEKYLEGKEKFLEKLPGGDRGLKNIAMNMFLDIFVHIDMSEYSFFAFYLYFSACMAAVSLLAYTAGYANENTEADFIASVSLFSRSVSHSSAYIKPTLEYLEKYGTETVNNVASFIK